MTLLNAHPLDDVDCRLKKPVEVGCFSSDEQGQIRFDRSQLKCIVDHVRTGRVFDKVDLNDGYKDRYIQQEGLTGLDKMLRWMLENRDRFYLPDSGPKEGVENIIGEYPDFVAWRSNFSKILYALFDTREKWAIECQKLHKTIYMCTIGMPDKHDSESESKPESESETKSDSESEDVIDPLERLDFWGQRFKSYMIRPFSGHDETKPIVDQKTVVVDQHQQFHSVLSSNLNQRHSLLYGSRIDCCDPSLEPPDCYIDLRTNRVFSSRGQEENFYRYKAVKLWAHSYVTGIAETICGFRNDDGMLRTIDRFYTAEFPEFAKQLRNSWNPVTSLNFLDSILSDVKKMFEKCKLSENDLLIFSWSPEKQKIAYSVCKNTGPRLLRDWYVKEMSSLVPQESNHQSVATKDL